ncbi:TPA: DNA repair protein RadC [Legionella pneumophila subsp. pneumophila]|nr:DNA repair protein RadC [Legionella pneumophila subsp. pneumophila]
MSYFTEEEQQIINQAIAVMNSKLKEEMFICNNVSSIKQFLRLQMEQCQREHLGVLYLDTQLRLIEYRIVFSGAVNYCTMSPREIVKDALQLNATAIIMAHNHPSGVSEPSRADVASTIKAREALKLFEIKLVDHFVVGKGQISSMVESGLI